MTAGPDEIIHHLGGGRWPASSVETSEIRLRLRERDREICKENKSRQRKFIPAASMCDARRSPRLLEGLVSQLVAKAPRLLKTPSVVRRSPPVSGALKLSVTLMWSHHVPTNPSPPTHPAPQPSPPSCRRTCNSTVRT